MSFITIQTTDVEIIVRSRQPQLATLETFEVPHTSTVLRYTKVLADGTRVTAGDSRTDHVAVIDNTTGLMWSVESLGDQEDADTGINQDACKTRCSELRLLGFSDWRLPTRTELSGLVDDCQHEPAIDTDAFPRVKPRWHWTSTPAAWSPASAWCVYFYGGGVNGLHRSSYGFALAVRRAGQ
ncbi:DUF1566 domain-containing protein [Xanthomonas melonis]|uniref:Lcl C-terminal domain-containing protein n=1 Tax=Xanthomonas melonis TaxID=56456 RepID=A0A2S7DEP8_9XANT|nr:DUF1566 domain-containing protein [Xanthomonas melonis]MCC4600271.1 DUF1566 domain-containing protein [Xanthomonas melonis]PPU72281.1 hypothetical protein XmelCFBP4644_12445 [Xanthomonas melonis]